MPVLHQPAASRMTKAEPKIHENRITNAVARLLTEISVGTRTETSTKKNPTSKEVDTEFMRLPVSYRRGRS